jgi:hypothetical protein
MVFIEANEIGIKTLGDPPFTRKPEQTGNVAGHRRQNGIEPMASAG